LEVVFLAGWWVGAIEECRRVFLVMSWLGCVEASEDLLFKGHFVDVAVVEVKHREAIRV